MKPTELFDLSGKRALITGGSRGLGLQIAEAMADAGARIVISSRNAVDLKEAKAHLERRGAQVDYVVADNGKDQDLIRLADEALSILSKVDILVNNAGASHDAPAEDYSIEIWDAVMNINVRAPFILSQYLAKHSMIPNRYGRILNVASIAGLRGVAGSIAYSTSKAAIVNLTRSLATEWGCFGVNVNAIAPGLFPSKMTAEVLNNFGTELFADAAPLRRIGDDQDLKGASLLLVSDAGKHITGQVLVVDGGVSMFINGAPPRERVTKQ